MSEAKRQQIVVNDILSSQMSRHSQDATGGTGTGTGTGWADALAVNILKTKHKCVANI